MNHKRRDIIIKKRSSSPAAGKPSDRSMQLFDMCSYDIDSFRAFVQSSGFINILDVDDGPLSKLVSNDDELLLFSMRFLKQVLFNKQTIPFREGAREKRFEEWQDVLEARRKAQI